MVKKSAAQIFEIKTVRHDISQRSFLKLTVGQVLAAQAIANVVKSSFGPSGLDKMMVDDIGVRERLQITNLVIANIFKGCDCYQRRCHYS